MPLPPLRKHQAEAVNATIQQIENGNKRIFLSLPHGSGRTAVVGHLLSELATRNSGISSIRILIVHDRLDLVNASGDYLKQAFGNRNITIDINSEATPIVVSNIQAIRESKNLTKFHPQIDTIILLSVHNSGVLSQNAIDYLIQKYPTATVIGIGNALNSNSAQFWGAITYRYSMNDAINDGILVPINVIKSNALFNLGPSQNIKDITDRHEVIPERIKTLSQSILSNIENEKTIVICPSQEFATTLSNQINELKKDNNYSAAIISSLERNVTNEKLQNFRQDLTPIVLTAVDMLTTGVDLPNIKFIILARNITSEHTLYNIISRGIRPYRNKTQLNIIDYFENHYLEEIVTEIQSRLIEPAFPDVSKKIFSKTNFLFRDRKDIQGVLGVKDLAEELNGIIQKMPPERGAMIGIFGKWGRGKTFLVDETWKLLLEDKRFRRVDFHAWKYQDTPASWAYLYENLSQKYFNGNSNLKYNWLCKPFRILALNIKRHRFLQLIGLAIAAFIIFLTGYLIIKFKFEQSKLIESLIKYMGIPLVTISLLYQLFSYINTKYSSKAKDLFLKYAKKHSFKEHLGIQAEIQKEVLSLLKTWIPDAKLDKKKILLFIDDIDRCTEDKIIQIIDSLRVMLEDDEIARRLIVMAAIDERILKRSIKAKYRASIESDQPNLNKEDTLNRLTQEYIDKLFIASIRLGDLSAAERDEFFMELIKNDIIIEDISEDVSDVPVDVNEIESDGENITIPIIESAHNMPDEQTQAPVVRIDKLTTDEVNLLRASLKTYNNTTPRQIRIFYYRYLIARNLLIKQYEKLGNENIWMQPDRTKTFIDLIIAYSNQLNPLIITDHKVTVLQTETSSMKIFLLENTSAPTKDYGELLKVLDVVIAY